MTNPPAGAFSFGSATWPGLAKIAEEAGETQQVIGKFLATAGVAEHWDGTNLRERLEDELADLTAAIEFVRDHSDLDTDRMAERTAKKRALFEGWHAENLPVDPGGLIESEKDTFAANLVSNALREHHDDCELVGLSGWGRCIEPAIAMQWEDGSTNMICDEHAARATDRGVLVITPTVRAETDPEPGYRVVRSIYFKPSDLALARVYDEFADALAVMGEGLVVAADGHVAAFHERHERIVAELNTPSRGKRRRV